MADKTDGKCSKCANSIHRYESLGWKHLHKAYDTSCTLTPKPA